MCYLEYSDTLMVNKKFVRLTTPLIGLYFAELITILKEVRRKNRFDQTTGMFRLNRAYITEEIGIEPAEQRNIDQVLFKLGIITRIDPSCSDRIAVDMKRYFDILIDDTLIPEEFLSATSKLTLAEKRAAKEEGITTHVLDLFEETDESVRSALSSLIQVHFKRGMWSDKQWLPVIELFKACTQDTAGKLKLIDYILSTNYVSIPAAIDSFMKKYAGSATKLNTKQTTCTGTMKDVEF